MAVTLGVPGQIGPESRTGRLQTLSTAHIFLSPLVFTGIVDTPVNIRSAGQVFPSLSGIVPKLVMRIQPATLP